VCSTPGVFEDDVDSPRTTASVRASDAPGGNCSTVIR
jgi:hypothetical protein